MNKYKHFGVMLDCSRNAVMRPDKVEKFIDCISVMGYNMLELYIEDTYEVEGEPYFGYLRGGYTAEELINLDEYAAARGVELVPAVQTLAHFTNLVKLPHYADIVDINDILLIGEEKTYILIDKIFATLARTFKTRMVNIGMDEAHMAGLGKYLDKNGYTDRYELIFKHLERVSKIAENYGFKLHMWSDMFFRLKYNGQYYGKNRELDPSIGERIPANVEPVYWDYYHTDTQDYDDMMIAHNAFNRNKWFAGGAWCWGGFAPFNEYSLKTMKAAMQSVINNNVENVIITMWGDSGKECSFFAVLPSLYATRQYADGVFDEQTIKDGFKKLFNIPFDAFCMLDLPNLLPIKHEELETPCKALLYCDPFLGILDDIVEKEGEIPYDSYAKSLASAGAAAGEYKYIFDCLSSLCSVLELKYNLGVCLRKAYKAADRAALRDILPRFNEICSRTDIFYESFRALWMEENKPFGFEIHDIRIGGLKQRLLSCHQTLSDYLSGKIEKIAELECEILPYHSNPTLYFNVYRNLVSVSEL